VEAADAYYGIGTGYLGRCTYDDAVRYLDIAQSRLLSIGHTAKYCGALRALRDCYERLNKTEAAMVFQQRIEQEEGELLRKMKKIDNALSQMKERLISTTADIEHTVHLERASHRALSLRNRLKTLHDDLTAAEAVLDAQREDIHRQHSLLDEIQKEIDDAFETDEPEMMSRFVNDQPQVIEIEELRKRLPKRKLDEMALLESMIKEEKSKETVVRNIEDDIELEEMNLAVEEGSLSRHVRHDKPFRVVALNPANAAGYVLIAFFYIA
jgi:DNA repair exonuclease SbcCD ATPase subunit